MNYRNYLAALALGTITLATLTLTACSEADKPAETTASESAPKVDAKALSEIPKGATVWINTDTLLAHYDWYQKSKKELEGQSQKAESELKGRMGKFENEYRSAQQQAQSGALSQSQMQELQSTMMQKQQAIESYKNEQGNRLMEQEKKFAKQLSKTMRGYLVKFAKENGYAYVMGYTEPGQVLYADPKLDVTAAVIEGINKEPVVQE